MSPFRRLWNTIRRSRLDDELRQEMETHLALLEEDEQAEGRSAEHSRQQAKSRFGNPLAYREQAVDQVIAGWFERVCKEFWFAGRRLSRAPAFTFATVFTLALAIGANVAVFAVVYRVLLNPLPYGDSARLVAVDNGFPDRNIQSGVNLTAQLYFQYLDRARTLEGIAVYRTDERTLTGGGTPERVRIGRTTPSLVPVLRVHPEQGRWFTEDEGAPGASPVAVISHGLWVRRYGQDKGIVGRPLVLDSVPTTIVGVMPASFGFPDSRIEMWIPDQMSRTTASSPASAGVYDLSAIARMRPGVTNTDVRTELTRLAAELAPANPGQGYDRLVSAARPLIDVTVGRVASALWMLLGAVALVFLIACSNIANLFFVRAEVKQREIALRQALGGGGGAIASYFLAESTWLGLAGGTLGLGLAWAAVQCLVALGPANLPRLQEVHVDAIAVAVAATLSMMTGAVFGLMPLLRLETVAMSLHDSGRGNTASRGRHRTRHVLMATQMALALVLVVASGLLLRSFQRVRAVDPGFDASSALTFRIGLPSSEYRDRPAMVAAYRAILDRLSAEPGVKAVSAATCLPLGEQGCMSAPLVVYGRTPPPGEQRPQVRFVAIAGGYFETMGTRIQRGRGIDRRDVEQNEPVAVVNEALVRLSFKDENPLGQRIRVGNPAPDTPGWLTIVGVASNTSYRTLTEATPVPIIYMPIMAPRVVNITPQLGAMSYVVRTVTPPEDMTAAARHAVGEIDPHLALAQVMTLQDMLGRASAQMAFTMVLLAIAALVALVIGVIGIYGAMSYIVSQRTGEIGVRLALGASPGSVSAMILRQGGIVALAGVSAGLTAAFAGGRLIESLLYGVSPRDPMVFATTTAMLLSVALAACWLPARRAARLTPLEALRAE